MPRPVPVPAPHRPALRYFGGKWRIAPWIIGFFPPHVCYVEPFAGAASVLLRKRPSRFEYLNDADGEVVNFFQVLREDYDRLVRALELTPFAREELARSYDPAGDRLERARRFYVRIWQGRSGARKNRTGWRNQVNPARNKAALKDFTDLSHLQPVIARLREVGIENGDALEVLRRYDAPGTLFYVDPPYLASKRSSERYAEDFHRPEDHRILAAAMRELEGNVVLSGYPSDLYSEIFEEHGWERHEKASRTQSGNVTEAVWLNPACQQAQRQLRLVDA